MDRSRPMREESIGEIRDTLNKRFQRLVRARAKATGMCVSEFREWVDELVGEGIALALSDIDKWDETKGDFLYWAFLKTRNLMNEELRKRGTRPTRDHSIETTTIQDNRQRHDPQKRLQVKEQLKEIFQLLTRDQGEALVFRHLIGIPVKEMEALTGRPGFTIYSLLRRAKERSQKFKLKHETTKPDWRQLPRPKKLKIEPNQDLEGKREEAG